MTRQHLVSRRAFLVVGGLVASSGCMDLPTPEEAGPTKPMEEVEASLTEDATRVTRVALEETWNTRGDPNLALYLNEDVVGGIDHLILVAPNGKQWDAIRRPTGQTRVVLSVDASHTHGEYEVAFVRGGEYDEDDGRVYGGSVVDRVSVDIG